MARLLEEKLSAAGLADLAFPREASALFVRLPNEIVERMHGAWLAFLKLLRTRCLPADVFLGHDQTGD